MAAIIGDTGLITSWTNNTALISSSSNPSAPSAFTLNLDAPAIDITAFSASTLYARSVLSSLRSWSGTIKSRVHPAVLGAGGNVTFTNNYATNIKSYRIRCEWPSFESTAFTGSVLTSRSFIPGLLKWSGSYSANVDGTTALILPGVAVAALTMKVIEDGATDVQMSGNATCTRASTSPTVGNLVEVSYDFEGSGDLTSQKGGGTYTNWLWNNGAVPIPTPGTLTMQSATSRTYAGSAFPTSVELTVAPGEIIGIEIGFQGSGDLTIG